MRSSVLSGRCSRQRAARAAELAAKEAELDKYLEQQKATAAELDALKDELDESSLPAAMKHAKVDWDDIIIEARIGTGAFGEVFKGRFMGRRWR